MSGKLFLLLTFVLSMLLVGSASALTVTGTITVGGVGLQDVSVVASGGTQGATAAGISTATGAYTCNHSATTTGNMLVLTPAKVGYIFNPAGSTFNLTSNASGKNFTATAVSTYVISGSTGNVDGVTLSGLPYPYNNLVTSGGGFYSAMVNTGWSGTVTPSKTGYTFSPTNKIYSSVTSNQTAQDYTPTDVSVVISGSVGNLDGVTMGGLPVATVTSGGGSYSATVNSGWSGTVTPSKTGYIFSPVNNSYTSVTSSVTGQNYTPTLLTYTITGSAVLDGVTMSGLPGSPVTSGGGLYSATVDYGWIGTVTPTKAGNTFYPSNATYSSVTSNKTQNYTPDKIFVNGDVNNNFSLANNWNPAGMPTAGDRVMIPGDAAGAVGPVIDSNVNIGSATNNVVVVGNGGTGTALMTVNSGIIVTGPVSVGSLSDGIMTINGGIWNTAVNYRTWNIGTAPDVNGVINMNGGTVYTGELILKGTGSSIIMTGGSIKASNDIELHTGTGIALDGGIIEQINTAYGFRAADAEFLMECGSVLDITEGQLILNGNATAAIDGYVNVMGVIKGYGDPNKVYWDYNVTTAGKTTVWALEEVRQDNYTVEPKFYSGFGTGSLDMSPWSSAAQTTYNLGSTAVPPGTGTGYSFLADYDHKNTTLDAFEGVNTIGASQIVIDFWYYDHGLAKNSSDPGVNSVKLRAINNDASWNGLISTNIDVTEDQWTHLTYVLTDQQFMRVDFKVRFNINYITSGDQLKIDELRVIARYPANPTQAIILSPANNQKCEPLTRQLSWASGMFALTHDVYVGTNFDDVNNTVDNSNGLLVSDNQTGNTFAPALEYGKTYYWRVDENYNNGTIGTLKGQVWNFATISELPADPNLVGWWKFDDDGGAMAWDYTGKGNHGTLKNTTFVDGQLGKALNFVAANKAYVDIPAAVFNNVNDEVTISLWQNGSTLQPANQSIFNGQNAANARVLNSHLPYGSGMVYFDAGYLLGASPTYDRMNKTATADQYKGQWNHWAFTKNTVTGQMKVYYNGILWQNATGMTKLMNGITKFKIGGDAVGTTTYYDGMVDDFRVYNRELNSTDIMILAGNNSAYNFSPANNAVTTSSVLLNWDSFASEGAKFDVYLSSNFQDVNTSASGALVADGITDSQYQKNDLALNTTYYWAVDVNDNGNIFLSPVIMSFTTANSRATNPSPADDTQMIAATQLSWTSTIAMTSQDVYFGTDSDLVGSRDVSTILLSGTTATSAALTNLVSGTTYFWMVDTHTSAGTDTMGVWSFTAGTITDPNLVGWWKMDDPAGLMAWDYSGYAHHGTFKGDANIIPDDSEYALNLDSTGDSVDIVGYRGILGGHSRTTCAWIKTSTTSSNPSTIISWGKNTAGQQWQFRVDGSGDTNPYVLRTACMNGYSAGTTQVNDGNWHHVAAVLANDGTANVNEIKMYLDGVEQAYTARSDQIINTISSNDVKIGRWISSSTDYMNGKMKDVRLYDKALTQVDIWTLIGIDTPLDDLQNVVDNWLTAGPAGDLNSDGIIDLRDFNLAAQGWGWQN